MKNNCKYCGNKTNNPKFCNKSCAASYNNKHRTHSEDTKRKISKSVKKYINKNGPLSEGRNLSKWETLTCPTCGKEKQVLKCYNRKICSKSCIRLNSKQKKMHIGL